MRSRMFVSLVALTLVGAACDDDGTEPGMEGPYTLTFAGDASFQAAHGGQAIQAALVGADGTVEATMEGTVSGTEDPSFSFTFADALEEGQSYEIHYWIDSNFGDGTPQVCDGPDTDHQWRIPVDPATDDRTITDAHRPGETESVCETFAADLTFQGDASFQGAHGGQAIEVGVVRSSDGQLVTSMTDTVSATMDPAFSFDFPGALLKGTEYEVHYWIDSNFGGGTAGACDPVDVDHQWSVMLGSTTDDSVTQTEAHDPTTQSAVCSTFE